VKFVSLPDIPDVIERITISYVVKTVKPFEGALRLIRRRGTPPGLGGPNPSDKRKNDSVGQNARSIAVVNIGFDRSTGGADCRIVIRMP
jgi:hypothetical protein